MAEGIVSDKTQAKAEQWQECITEQQRSGLTVKQFCTERGLSSWSFYKWRKQLSESGPVRFALVERRNRHEASSSDTDLELLFATGERLRIRRGVDGATLRTVVEVVRA
jgi:transposase-like protein